VLIRVATAQIPFGGESCLESEALCSRVRVVAVVSAILYLSRAGGYAAGTGGDSRIDGFLWLPGVEFLSGGLFVIALVILLWYFRR
jgi:hypothetical protein